MGLGFRVYGVGLTGQLTRQEQEGAEDLPQPLFFRV